MKARRLSTILTIACLAAMLALVVEPLRSAPATPLSEAQLTKIVSAIDKSDWVRVVDPKAAVMLELPTNRENRLRYIFFKTSDGTFHIFGRLNASADYLVTKRSQNLFTYLRADADLQIVAGLLETHSIPNTPNNMEVLPRSEAANVLNQELAAWANYADNSMDKTPETPIGNK